MALPTAATPGYVAYPGVLYGPDVACSCLARWLYLFRKLCVAKGYGEPVVWQLTGDADASAGVHSLGGAFDLGGLGNDRAMLAREAGAVAWPRNWTNNRHTHGVIDCPHNERARYQRTACIVYRKDGLGYKGLQGPDPLPPPSKWRNYEQGIEWMKAELARLNTEEIDMATADYISEQLKAVSAQVADYDRKNQIRANALAAAIQALAAGVEPAVEQAVKDALTEAVVDVNVNFPTATPEA